MLLAPRIRIARVRTLLGRHRTTKGLLFIMLVSGIMLFVCPTAGASWLIDPDRFHVSAHGQISCRDCHEDFERNTHPDSADIVRNRLDFFKLEQCLECHDQIQEDLGKGLHGALKVEDVQAYETCINCHDPHYQLSLGKNRMADFDPAKPPRAQCGVCHEERTTLPALGAEEAACMECHREADLKRPEEVKRLQHICFNCHAPSGTPSVRKAPLIDAQAYRISPHAGFGCVACHPAAADFNHSARSLGDCRRCHYPHDEKVARDAHLTVACEACHLEPVRPVKEPSAGRVVWTVDGAPEAVSRVHNMILMEDEAACTRCHFKGNGVGAAAAVLPAKSILCMPCHAATFSVGDATTVITLIVFLAGLALISSVWWSGSKTGTPPAHPIGATRKIRLVVKALLLDVLLQRRLWRQSPARWLIHSLIFYSIAFRFVWGLTALIGTLCWPERSFSWIMVNKNQPATAFLFDLTGLMILLGVALALARGFMGSSQRSKGAPPQDRFALSLIGGIVIVGFVLEGMRMAMTGIPAQGGGAFIGAWLGSLFSDSAGITGPYAYVWYIHAVLTGAFIAYLPFSRLFHIIVAPVVLAINASRQDEERG
ncbi:MAG: respiratory nitrate reductase subunit gamma [Deltaproteobacteria bacterium]|nr:respiratory nitrate reductase subunit gamma [Deltaproteobacteria bacterium]